MSRYQTICKATTKRGTRCTKNKNQGSDYCVIHNKMEIITEVCSICLETPTWNKTQILGNCNHQYCSKCINEWLCNDDKCPNCRTVIGPSDELIFNKYAVKNKKFVYIRLTTLSFDNVTNEEYSLFFDYFNIFFTNTIYYQPVDVLILEDYLRPFPPVYSTYLKAKRVTEYSRYKRGIIKKQFGIEISDQQLERVNNGLQFMFIVFKDC